MKAARLRVSMDDVPEVTLVPARFLSGGSVGAKVAYGRHSSVMVATRQPGYHSKPHRHPAEQLNYVLDGELYVFVGEDGFLARRGDVFRVPGDAVHWSWVRGDGPCVLLEVHTPPLIDDPGVRRGAVALCAADEDAGPVEGVRSEWPDNVEVAVTERAVLAREGER